VKGKRVKKKKKDEKTENKTNENGKKRKAEADTNEQAPKEAKTDSYTLFVGNLAWATTEEGLKTAFEECGVVAGSRVIKDKQSGYSKGYGYVDFETKEGLEKALQTMQNHELDGRQVNLDKANSGGGGGQRRGNDRGGFRGGRGNDRGFRGGRGDRGRGRGRGDRGFQGRGGMGAPSEEVKEGIRMKFNEDDE